MVRWTVPRFPSTYLSTFPICHFPTPFPRSHIPSIRYPILPASWAEMPFVHPFALLLISTPYPLERAPPVPSARAAHSAPPSHRWQILAINWNCFERNARLDLLCGKIMHILSLSRPQDLARHVGRDGRAITVKGTGGSVRIGGWRKSDPNNIIISSHHRISPHQPTSQNWQKKKTRRKIHNARRLSAGLVGSGSINRNTDGRMTGLVAGACQGARRDYIFCSHSTSPCTGRMWHFLNNLFYRI